MVFWVIKKYQVLCNGNYGIFGQYNLRKIFNIDFNSFCPKFNSELIIAYLENKNYNIIKIDQISNFVHFQINSQNNSFAIQFIMGFYRLVSFDDYERHMSDANYNNNFPKIDELFYSVDSLYAKLDSL